MYKLIGSHTSPYVRKLRLYLINQNIPFEFQPINYLEANDALYLKTINPINKIPVLIIDQEPLYDSRVIFNRFNKKPLSIQDENIISAIDGAMDTAINLFSLKRGGLDISNSQNPYIIRQTERIDLIFQFLRPWIEKVNQNPKQNWDFLTMSLYSFVFWANFRDMLDLSPYPYLKDFLAIYADCLGVEETKII